MSLGRADLHTILRLLGYGLRQRLSASHHVLWVIEHEPTLDIGIYWTVPAELAEPAKRIWRKKMKALSQAQVFANAAWSLASSDEAWAEARYEEGEAFGGSDVGWWREKASLFEMLADSAKDEVTCRRHRLSTATALVRAFVLETNPEQELGLVSGARQAYGSADKGGARHRLLRLADSVGTTARRAGVETAPGRHMLHVVRGLVALARDDRDGALVELNSARDLLTSSDALDVLTKELLTESSMSTT